jgi:hypothetical protein
VGGRRTSVVRLAHALPSLLARRGAGGEESLGHRLAR